MKFNADIRNNKPALKAPVYHGHTKITLTDVKTKEVEVIESDNIVTDAVYNLLKHPYFGVMDLNDINIMPVKNLFAGVMCFSNTITADKTNYKTPSESQNTLIAHAGDEANVTASNLRGNPNGAESEELPNGYKFVWDFATNQGNGTISTVCLTHRVAGNLGTMPLFEYNEHPFKSVTSKLTNDWLKNKPNIAWSREQAVQNPVIYNPDTREGVALFQVSTSVIEVIHVVGGVSTFSINDVPRVFVEKSAQTVACNIVSTYFSCFVEDSSTVVIFSHGGITGSNTHINYWRINVNTYAVSSGTWTFPTNATATNINRSTNTKYWGVHPLYPYSNGYLYLPTKDNNSFVKLNVNNNADVSVLQTNIGAFGDWEKANGITPIAVNENLIVGAGYLINHDRVYHLKQFDYPNRSTQNNSIANTIACALFDGCAISFNENTTASYAISSGVVINPYYLATINNLDNPITKLNSQTMKIEYTIREEI